MPFVKFKNIKIFILTRKIKTRASRFFLSLNQKQNFPYTTILSFLSQSRNNETWQTINSRNNRFHLTWNSRLSQPTFECQLLRGGKVSVLEIKSPRPVEWQRLQVSYYDRVTDIGIQKFLTNLLPFQILNFLSKFDRFFYFLTQYPNQSNRKGCLRMVKREKKKKNECMNKRFREYTFLEKKGLFPGFEPFWF